MQSVTDPCPMQQHPDDQSSQPTDGCESLGYAAQTSLFKKQAGSHKAVKRGEPLL